MATGIVIEWKKGQVPEKDQIELELRRYLDGCGSVQWLSSTWYANLHGHPNIEWMTAEEMNGHRFFEVYCGLDAGPSDSPFIEVMVRPVSRDEFTRAVARGFAELVARTLDGNIRPV